MSFDRRDTSSDELTSLWARVDSATAFAAGYPVEPSLAGPADGQEHRAVAAAIDGAIAACPAEEELTRAALKSMRTQADDLSPLRQTKDAVEWLRALIYRKLAGSPLAREVEGALRRRIDGLREAYRDTPPLLKLLCTVELQALAVLTPGAGAAALGAAVARLLDGVHRPPGKVGLDEARKVVADSRENAVVTPQRHRELLADAFGFEETAEEIDHLAHGWLADELERTEPLVQRIGERLGFSVEDRDLETVVTELSNRRRPGERNTLDEARRQTRIALPLFEERLVELTPAQRAVDPESTPSEMEPLVTEGEEYIVDALGEKPRAFCFITEGECGSAYTLANVLYHELAHCWNMLAAAAEASGLPAPARAGGAFGKILLEGIAFHREWEVYELYEESVRAGDAEGYASLFDGLGVRREEAVLEFELETRYWRLARYLRALFDARVHSGRQGYVPFLRDQEAATGFTQNRIHRFCFHFFANPGYAPCYAVGGKKLAALQEESLLHGLARREFNTRVNRMGLVPPAFWRRLLRRSPTDKDEPR